MGADHYQVNQRVVAVPWPSVHGNGTWQQYIVVDEKVWRSRRHGCPVTLPPDSDQMCSLSTCMTVSSPEASRGLIAVSGGVLVAQARLSFATAFASRITPSPSLDAVPSIPTAEAWAASKPVAGATGGPGCRGRRGGVASVLQPHDRHRHRRRASCSLLNCDEGVRAELQFHSPVPRHERRHGTPDPGRSPSPASLPAFCSALDLCLRRLLPWRKVNTPSGSI